MWAACRDNIHAFAQLLALFRQLPDNLEAASITDSLLKQNIGAYHRPLESHASDASLEGVGIYIDNQKMEAVHSMLAFGKSFEKTFGDDEKRSKQLGSTSNLSKQYPFKKPSNPELKGWSGTFANLELCIGVAVKRDVTNDCLLRPDGVFVWSERTLAKLGGGGADLRAKKLRLAFQMMQFMYALMMGKGAIADGVPLAQYLGPLKPS